MKNQPTFQSPIPWDIKTKTGTHETVRFNSHLVLIGDIKYKICGTRNYYEDCVHILQNVETGEWKEVTGKTIRVWINKLKKKYKNT